MTLNLDSLKGTIMNLLTTKAAEFDVNDWSTSDPGEPYEFAYSVRSRDALRDGLRSRVESARKAAKAARRDLVVVRGSDIPADAQPRPDRVARCCRGCRCKLTVAESFAEPRPDGAPVIFLCDPCFEEYREAYTRVNI